MQFIHIDIIINFDCSDLVPDLIIKIANIYVLAGALFGGLIEKFFIKVLEGYVM